MNIPVCVCDGHPTGTIKVGKYKFNFDLSDLSDILEFANMKLRDSSASQAPILRRALDCIQNIVFEVQENSAPASTKDNKRNLLRYKETGCTGYHDLSQVEKT